MVMSPLALTLLLLVKVSALTEIEPPDSMLPTSTVVEDAPSVLALFQIVPEAFRVRAFPA